MRRSRAFTLIELLVVIAIISVLAAILFPVFSAARAKARSSLCASQERQIAAALLLYAQDYDETFPRPWYWQEVKAGIWPDWYRPDDDSPTGGWCYCGWDAKVQPYIHSRAIFICPDDSYMMALLDPWDHKRLPQDDTSYGLNASGCAQTSLGDIELPAATILVAETKSWHRADYPKAVGDPREMDGPEDLLMCDVYRHRGGANYAFADGHVKWLKPAQSFHPVNLWRRTKSR